MQTFDNTQDTFSALSGEKLMCKTIPTIWEFISINTCLLVGIAVRRLGQFIPICFGCCKEIELWIRCDGLSFFCPFVSLFKHQTKKLMCKISGFLWEIISAKYMYLGQNYCKMFRAVYSIYFRVHTQIEPRIGRDVLFMFCPCLLCLVLNLKCCYHTVSWWLKKKFGSSFGIISCSLHEC